MSINKILFIGSKSLGLVTLKTIYSISSSNLIGIITIDDTGDTRSEYNQFRSFAKKNNIRLDVVKNRREFNEIITQLRPDLCVVVCWYWIISKRILESVKNGFIGVHNSLLPEYRGGSPLVWQVINGEKEVGFSIFSFTEGIDEGDIWGQVRIKINDQEYINEILYRIENDTILWFKNNFKSLLAGDLTPVPQDHNKATYCSQRFPFDGEIKWYKPTIEVYNFIRAQSHPYPGAFTFLNGEKLIIWSAELIDVTYYGEPGQISKVTNDGAWVICGDNQPLLLKEVQLGEGEIINSCKIIKSFKIRL